MTAALDRISAAIATDLDADPSTNFGYDFVTVESGGDWDLELEDDGPPGNPNRLHVDLVGVYDRMELHSHPSDDGTKDVRHVCTFQVIVRRRLAAKDRIESSGRILFAVVQGLTECVEKIAMYFMCRTLSTLAEATWIHEDGDGIELIRYPKDLRENSQFTGIARISYELVERD